jgi:hypothetical protein
MKIELLSLIYSPCHLFQNDVWFTVIGQALMIRRPLEVWECNAFTVTYQEGYLKQHPMFYDQSLDELNERCEAEGAIQGVANKLPIKILGTRLKARNCISEPCPQESYWDIGLTSQLG